MSQSFFEREWRTPSRDLAQHLPARVIIWRLSCSCHSVKKLDQGRPSWKDCSQETTFSERDREKRLRHAKTHRDWSKDQWKRGLWSDESEMFRSGRWQYVRSRRERRIRVAAFSDTWWRLCQGFRTVSPKEFKLDCRSHLVLKMFLLLWTYLLHIFTKETQK